MDPAQKVYWLTRQLPKEELYSLTNQMRRTAVSIPLSITEGQDRNSNKKFLHFLSIARGSKAELEHSFRYVLSGMLCRYGHPGSDTIIKGNWENAEYSHLKNEN